MSGSQMQAEIGMLLQSLPALLAHHREAEAAPHATDNAQKPADDASAPQTTLQEAPADGLNRAFISKLAQAWFSPAQNCFVRSLAYSSCPCDLRYCVKYDYHDLC